MIGHGPEIGIIEDRPRNPSHDLESKKPESPAGTFPAFPALRRGRGKRLYDGGRGFAEQVLDGAGERRRFWRVVRGGLRADRGGAYQLAGGFFFSICVPVFAARLEDGGRPPGV